MEINYIILAHTKPQQVARMLERLVTRDTRFYIHIDKDVDICPFKKELGHFSNTFFLSGDQRIPGLWGDYGMVQATLNCIKQIVADKRKGYCVLMSGQDYPIKSTAYIHDFFSRAYGANFIQGFPIQSIGIAEQGTRRINRYKIKLSNGRDDYLVFPSVYDSEFYRKKNFKEFLILAKRKSIGSLMTLLPKTLIKRNFPTYIQPYKGSQWWALPMETIHFILDFIQEHPDYPAYHQYTFAPDEIFFQSIIFSLFSQARIRKEVTYVNWSSLNNVGPVILEEKDLGELMDNSGDKLFARKFDIEIDSHILDLIDRETL
jgi:hypothetical protein